MLHDTDIYIYIHCGSYIPPFKDPAGRNPTYQGAERGEGGREGGREG
jgi:hypothetical protein